MEHIVELSTTKQPDWQAKEYRALINDDTQTLVFQNDDILLPQEKNKINLLNIDLEKTLSSRDPLTPLACLSETVFQNSFKYYLGRFNQRPLYAVLLQNPINSESSTSRLEVYPLRSFLQEQSEILGELIRRAKQLLYWHKTNLFCGSCSGTTHFSSTEVAKICQKCQRIIYPHTSPAVMVLIERNDKILLARSHHFRPGVYSVLAGFVEAGESAEQAVVREVHEEVGLKLKNIRYMGSQSWPFENSFMLGFRAEYDSGEIRVNLNEIETADWFSVNQLPLLPFRASLAWKLIDEFLAEKKACN